MYTKLVLELSDTLAQVYDKVYDHYHQNEVALAHAALRAFVQFHESQENDTKEEIRERLDSFIETMDDDEEDEPISTHREALLDRTTMDWITRVQNDMKKSGADHDETTIYMNGIIILSIMLDVVRKSPTARLSIFPIEMPLRQIIAVKPQLHN